jgi:aminoglycoside N3'-acetyltransferase
MALVTSSELTMELRQLGVPDGSTVLVHTSL